MDDNDFGSDGRWPPRRLAAHGEPLYQSNVSVFDAAFRPQNPSTGTPYAPESAHDAFNAAAGMPVDGAMGRPTSGLTGGPRAHIRPMPLSTMTLSSHSSQPQLPPVGRVVDSPGQPIDAAFSGPAAMWDQADRYSPTDSVDDIIASPNLSDYALDGSGPSTSPISKSNAKGRGQRRPSNRDEFDGPHQFLQRPSAVYLSHLERELPHLPTNLHVHEQDAVLENVNVRLSMCAFDFVAKYQFPIPLAPEMRPVERPQDREWTEWVYLLKRLATKRRIPARVLYNGQIKQFVTILENSLEMRHASKHRSRPLKDDRNILQLISAGIQVAKILKDAAAMEYLNHIYVRTEKMIQDRISSRPERE